MYTASTNTYTSSEGVLCKEYICILQVQLQIYLMVACSVRNIYIYVHISNGDVLCKEYIYILQVQIHIYLMVVCSVRNIYVYCKYKYIYI
jgi:hypothetical protein